MRLSFCLLVVVVGGVSTGSRGAEEEEEEEEQVEERQTYTHIHIYTYPQSSPVHNCFEDRRRENSLVLVPVVFFFHKGRGSSRFLAKSR